MAPRKPAKPAAEPIQAEAEAPAKAKVAKAPKAKPAKSPAPAAAEPAPAKKAAPKAPKGKAVPAPKPEPIPEPVKAEAPKPLKAKGKAPKAEPVAAVEAAAPSAPAPAATPGALPAHVQTLLACAQQQKAVELIFKDADANPPRTFEPRQLCFDTLSQAWYIWGWDRRYNAERHHRVDLLAEANPVEGPGRAAQGPYKEGTPANLIGGWLGGEPIAVKAMLMKQWTFAVKQAPPAFPEFQMEDKEEGKALISFTATDLRAIARWVMQFGDGLQVLEPARLVDRLKQVGIVWGGKPAAAPAPVPPPAPKPEARREERREERKAEPRREERREHKHEERRDHKHEDRRPEGKRDEAKPKGPRVEVRIERL